jgi:tetratricopeptide (TPR) repeat protein
LSSTPPQGHPDFTMSNPSTSIPTEVAVSDSSLPEPHSSTGTNAGPQAARNWSYLLGLWGAAAVGLTLRWWSLGDQFLLDDEWHALTLAATRDLGWIVTHFAYAANSIPFNLFARATLSTTGWNEWIVRAPSIVAGLALLWCVYRFHRATQPVGAAPLAVALVAVSPLLIGYSRIARPYGLHVLLCFLVSWEAYRWATSGGNRRGWWFGVLSVLALWVHQVALFPVIAAWLLVSLGAVIREWRSPTFGPTLRWWWSAGNESSDPDAQAPPAVVAFRERWNPLAMAFVAAIATSLVLLLPPVLLSDGFFGAYSSKEVYNLETLVEFASLAAGSANPLVIAAFSIAVLAGLVRAAWTDRAWFWLVTLATVTTFAGLYLIRAPYLSQPIVLARYAVALLPLWLICAADGFAWIGVATARITRLPLELPLSAALIAALAALGPLPNTLRQGGNFQHHATYQESYRDAEGSAAHSSKLRKRVDLTQASVPEFYKQARSTSAGAKGGIIEFPFPLGSDFCVAQFYQRTHQRPVFGGYLGSGDLEDPPFQSITSVHTIGSVMRALPPGHAVRWNQIVDITNPEQLRRSGAEYLVIHLDPLLESDRSDTDRGFSHVCEMENTFLQAIDRELRKSATPVHSDRWISVFAVADLPQGVPVPAASSVTFRRRAEIAMQNRDSDKALDLVERALAINPDDTPSVILSARLYEARKDEEKAFQRYRQALDLTRDKAARGDRRSFTIHLDFMARAARLAHATNRHAEALQYFNTLMEETQTLTADDFQLMKASARILKQAEEKGP